VIFTILRQNNDRQLTCPNVCANNDLYTVTTAAHRALRLQNQLAAPWNWVVQWVVEVSGCGQLADTLKVGRRDISMF